MSTLDGRELILGVTGSIAAYKAVYLLRELTRAGARVSVCLSERARGRLPEADVIVEALLTALTVRRDLDGQRVVVTAGPTREPIDPVRYISNRSSGRMGYALAAAAARRGALVTLVSGPTTLMPPTAATFVPVQTAEQMREAVLR